MAPIDLPFHLLNETEKLFLRMVHEGLTSREIGEARNMRADAVDRVLRAARGKLGGLTRHEVARLLVEHEAASGGSLEAGIEPAGATEGPRQSLGAQNLALADDEEIAPPHPTEDANGGPDGPPAFQLGTTRWTRLRSRIFGSDGSVRNDLDTRSRIAAISLVAAGAACIVGAGVCLFIVLDRIAVSL